LLAKNALKNPTAAAGTPEPAITAFAIELRL